MYRLLEVGEVIEEGDEWYTEELGWHKSRSAGNTLMINTPLRRLVKTAVTPAADESEGYRMLSVGEKMREGDEIYVGKWEKIVSTLVGSTMQDWDKSKVRRRIEKPAPVVSVGDRVTVLSGPWSGCTGVVIGFEADVILSDYGKMTAKYDAFAVVLLDYVFAGGQRLTVVSQVEKLPPVAPSVVYRDLAIGEVIRKGDEFPIGFDCWLPVVSIGAKWNHYCFRPMRRSVRIQSPGWRYLDAGETVQAGDEIKARGETGWNPTRMTVGKLLNENSGIESFYAYRRKLPANVGG